VAGDVTGQKDGPPGSWVRIDVADTGDGISPSVLPHVFEPFFSTKSPGRGSGLGLSQVRSLVAQHGGDVDIHSALGSGTVVSVWLPAARATPRLGPGGRGVVAPRGSGQLVLVVEDEPDLRDLLVDTLTTLGYRAEAVADGDAALRWLRRRGHCADVILSEVAMAGLGGEGLARRVHGAWPHLPVILTTSQAVAPTAPGLSLRAGDVSRLRKPFSTEQLAAAIARALR
jgi:CheY-like chemotaxis protein